jgi:hypothetical protein
MADRLLELADALVTDLDTLFAPEEEGDDARASAQWKADGQGKLDDLALLAAQVWVIDFADALLEENGVPIEEFKLLLVFQRRFGKGEDIDEVTRDMSLLVGDTTAFCRKTEILGSRCVKTEREPARNLDDHNQNSLFYAEVVTTWRRVYDD